MPPVTTRKAAASTGRRSCWVGCRHGLRHGRALENAASSLPGKPAATAANALPRLRPMVKLEYCWPWLERRGLQSTAKCSSAAPEALLALARVALLALARVGLTRSAHHQIVAVDHFRPAADAEDCHHIRRRAALDFFGILGVVGDEAAADLVRI